MMKRVGHINPSHLGQMLHKQYICNHYNKIEQQRVGPINPRHCGQMLHQQYICNHYNTIEQQHLYYHRIKDTDLTGEDFGMMLDAALPTDGRRPTAYGNLYIDVMAVVSRFAKPH
jgi:hypothetical protein